MAKVRVHELAKELNITSKGLLEILKEQGEFVKSASSTIEAPVVRKAREYVDANPEVVEKYPAKAPKKKKPSKAEEAPAPAQTEEAPNWKRSRHYWKRLPEKSMAVSIAWNTLAERFPVQLSIANCSFL